MPTQKKQMKILDQLCEEVRIHLGTKNLDRLCEEMRISSRTYSIPQQYQKRVKASQYKGVYWNNKRRKWYVQLSLNAEKQYCGVFNDEMDAAIRVNEICQEWGIPPQNPGISSMPSQQYQRREKTSQYQGVYWHAESGKWYAHLSLCSGKRKYGGIFDDELDAAKKVNQLCEELNISPRNPEITRIHNFSFLSLPAINPKCNISKIMKPKTKLL